MTRITVYGAGAFGTALAISMAASDKDVTLVPRSARNASDIKAARMNGARLPGFELPKSLTVSADMPVGKQIILLAVPTQALLEAARTIAETANTNALVACCKGVDLKTGQGPTATMAQACPQSVTAILSGPSFAVDIAAGLPTALSLASKREQDARALQQSLTTANLRIYRTTDVIGVELGGALKNVVAIAAGIAMGAGLGESARAAIMTRGYAETRRFAVLQGADPDTLSGLSGFGDLVLTATSEKSRNYSFGLALGRGQGMQTEKTVEGVTTARAVADLAKRTGVDMPVIKMVAELLANRITVAEAVEALLSRPLRRE